MNEICSKCDGAGYIDQGNPEDGSEIIPCPKCQPEPEPPAPSVEPSPEVAHDIHRMLPWTCAECGKEVQKIGWSDWTHIDGNDPHPVRNLLVHPNPSEPRPPSVPRPGEALPCPFCGSAADVCDPGTTERVACSNKECGVGRTLMRPEQWNRRAPLPSAPVSVGDAVKVVCLCGSSKHPDLHMRVMMEETLGGNIVIPMGLYGHADFPKGAKDATNDGDESTSVKQMLDALHFRKIELADDVIVVTQDSYIGSSTQREIRHAESLGKLVRFVNFPALPNPPPAGSETPRPRTDAEDDRRDGLVRADFARELERETTALRARAEQAERDRDTARNALDQTRTKSGWDAMVKCLKEEKDKAVCEAESKLRSYYRDEGFKLELAESETRCVKEDLGKEIATLKAERDAAHARIAELEKERHEAKEMERAKDEGWKQEQHEGWKLRDENDTLATGLAEIL